MAKGARSRVGLLLVLLLALGAGGAWNYRRNLERERAVPRPFRGYDEAALAAMADAYRAEIAQYTRRWEAERGRRSATSGRGLVGEKAREFESVQAASARTRALQRELAERETSLKQLERELARREAERDRLALHLRRLLTL